MDPTFVVGRNEGRASDGQTAYQSCTTTTTHAVANLAAVPGQPRCVIFFSPARRAQQGQLPLLDQAIRLVRAPEQLGCSR
eukprot:scaffold74414_cov97-Phaeocystis_antarctica.AAC.3